ncbi:MAG: pyruvate kinase [Candidatus Nealsonbacteria bacterium]
MLKIKILATLGPSSMKESVVKAMDFAGVDVFRVNLSHTKLEDFLPVIKSIQSWTKKPISIDSEGAQLRTGKFFQGSAVLKSNTIVSITASDVLGDESHIPLYPVIPARVLQVGDVLSLDFNTATVQVSKINGDDVSARVLFGGKVGSNKGVATDRIIDLPAFSEKTLKALELAREIKLDCFAFSFASKKEDVVWLRSFFPYPVFIISKIECRAGLANLKELCRVSDAILIDRGDLSREVPLPKIALIQRHILDVAKKIGTPVYVATNLLESMLSDIQPTRAEINDITSTVLSGAQGLVLAAETAVGSHPLESVRMVISVAKEVKNYEECRGTDGNDVSYLDAIYDYHSIEPHGGVLVQNFLDQTKKEETKRVLIEGLDTILVQNFSDPAGITDYETLPQIAVDEKTLLDIVQIAEGVYSPLRGFMDKEELFSVLDNYKLKNGSIWTLPILLQVKEANKELIGKTAALNYIGDRENYAVMKVSDIQEIDQDTVVQKWFSTTDTKHPGVLNFKQRGNLIISGEVRLLKKPNFGGYSHVLSPRQTRLIFRNFGWQKVVGFHTRNVIHRGHEFIQRAALESVGADALFISPVIGPKKDTDFSGQAILESYEVMLRNDAYKPYPALIGAFNTYSRYSGPREAVFTALCRKNFGCSHFIVGRDHTGVGKFYDPDASKKLFEKFGDELGIKPIMFDAVYFCQDCKNWTTNCAHSQEKKLSLSGTKVRECLSNNKELPEYLIRKEVAGVLQEMFKKTPDKVFEKNSN